jgi:pimeloyl-ACP methyl ester carboxylesterase
MSRQLWQARRTADILRVSAKVSLRAAARTRTGTANAPALRPEVRRRVLVEAGGNPLALIELPRAVDSGQFALLPVTAPLPLTERLERAFVVRVSELPSMTRWVLLFAARLVLAGTGPRGGQLMHGWISDVAAIANAENNGPDDLLNLFFEITETSRQRGLEYLKRFTARQDRDKPNGLEVRDAQYDAITEWGIPDPAQLNRLAGIIPPVLITAGDNDTMIPTVNAYLMAQHLPDARVRVYPDSGHGFLFQWPEQFAGLVTSFLSQAHEQKPTPTHPVATSA